MKTLTALIFFPAILFAEPPTGEVVELHSCEIYTGGCTVSAEATLGGRSMLRAWHIERGSHNGIDLSGLIVAAVEVADANLAMKETSARAAVVYLPEQSQMEQQQALADWLRSTQGLGEVVATRTTDLKFQRANAELEFAAGNLVRLETKALEQCGTGSCGEALWYQPRTKMQNAEVVVNSGSSVDEPLLQLKWRNNGTRSVFLGRFGAQDLAQVR
jgi:hypothetical protein